MSRSKDGKKVLVFGVFDNLHSGHKYFLKSAGKYGAVTAVIARDSVVVKMKGNRPLFDQNRRLEDVLRSGLVENAVLGDDDKNHGLYNIVRDLIPDVICIGYDQKELMGDLVYWLKKNDNVKIKIIKLKPYYPEKYKS